MILPPSASGGVRRGSDDGDVKVFPRVRHSQSVGFLLSNPAVAGSEWVRDDILKYKSSLTSVTSVIALQSQVKLANLEDSCKLVVQACGSDDFPFLRSTPGRLLFFFMYKCLFEVPSLILPLTAFQCALLEHLNVTPSQLYPNS